MADHKIKFSEVPKGQRFQQFKDYYLKSFILIILAICIIIPALKSTVFAPKPDFYVLLATKTPIPEGFSIKAQALYEKSGQDLNEDGEKILWLTDIFYDEMYMRNDPQLASSLQAKLMATLSTAENIIQIVDEGMYLYLEREGLIGTYCDVFPNENSSRSKEKIKVPLCELFSAEGDTDFLYNENLFLTVRARDASQLFDDDAVKYYEKQIQQVKNLLK